MSSSQPDTTLPSQYPSPFAPLSKSTKDNFLPPTYYGVPKARLPTFPASLADWRDGKYQYYRSTFDRDTRVALMGFLIGCFHRGFEHRTMLPFQRGLWAWKKHAVWTVVFVAANRVAMRYEKMYNRHADMRLEILRRLRDKSIEQVRFEAQRSLEGLPDDYPIEKMEKEVLYPRDPKVMQAAEEAARAQFYAV